MSDASANNPPATPGAQPATPAPPVDVRKLAEKVYQLMLADLRLERARGAPAPRRRK